MGALLALMAGISWGAGDFVAGRESRRSGAFVVTFWAQLTSLVLVSAVVLAVAATGHRLDWDAIWIGAAGGVSGALGLLAFFHAMSLAPMGLVAPIAASGVSIPVAASFLQGERVGTVALVGLVLTAAGVVLAARAAPRAALEAAIDPVPDRLTATALAFALLAALSFATFQVVLDVGGADQPTRAAHAAAGVRLGGVAMLLGVALVVRAPLRVAPSRLRPIAASGALDALANLSFALAAALTALAIAAVLGTLYPLVTALLAWLLLGERLSAPQRIGAAVVVAGVMLVAAG